MRSARLSVGVLSACAQPSWFLSPTLHTSGSRHTCLTCTQAADPLYGTAIAQAIVGLDARPVFCDPKVWRGAFATFLLQSQGGGG